ncbi:hypothetical protein AOLI_G00105910 [Acnodon oligacanthus]
MKQDAMMAAMLHVLSGLALASSARGAPSGCQSRNWVQLFAPWALKLHSCALILTTPSAHGLRAVPHCCTVKQGEVERHLCCRGRSSSYGRACSF